MGPWVRIPPPPPAPTPTSLDPYVVRMSEITPCLWFDGNADAAVDHYLSIFPNSRRVISADGPGSEAGSAAESVQIEAKASTLVVSFELDGRPFMALNGGPAFHFSPAVSFVVNCAAQDQVDYYWNRLLDGGQPSQCGWLTDRFGVSWQIVPDRLAELMADPDPARANRVFQAMLQMVKLDIAALEEAAG